MGSFRFQHQPAAVQQLREQGQPQKLLAQLLLSSEEQVASGFVQAEEHALLVALSEAPWVVLSHWEAWEPLVALL